MFLALRPLLMIFWNHLRLGEMDSFKKSIAVLIYY